MITREIDYAIREILCLAKAHGTGQILSVTELSAQMDIPYRFLRTLSRKLVAAKLVLSRRGNGGGLTLAREPAQISLLQVMRAIDPKSMVLNRCLVDEDGCTRIDHCPVHEELAEMQKKLEVMLTDVRFSQFGK